MTPCPPIITYQRMSGVGAPFWLARFTEVITATKGSHKGVPRVVLLPIEFSGASQDAVIQAAEDWWQAEQDKQAVAARSIADRLAKARAARGSKEDTA